MGWVASVQKGLASNAQYPLANHSIQNITGCRSPCNTTAAALSTAHIDGATCLPEAIHDNETQMMAWLQTGPLSVSIAAGGIGGYKGGIITACNDTRVDHAVLLVGYGTDSTSGLNYWVSSLDVPRCPSMSVWHREPAYVHTPPAAETQEQLGTCLWRGRLHAHPARRQLSRAPRGMPGLHWEAA